MPFGDYIAGFVDGEGSFSLIICDTGKGVRFRPTLKIKLKADDTKLLKAIRDFVGCGDIFCTDDNYAITWQTSCIQDCYNIIIPFFDKYPLRGQKAETYQLWKEAVNILIQKPYLPYTYKEKIELIELREGMNKTRRVHNRRTKEDLKLIMEVF